MELQLSDGEFWRLTPRELDLLTVAQRRKQRRKVLPMAVLVQLLANVNRDTKQRPYPFEVEEVMQWLGFPPEGEAPEAEPPRPTTEELRQKLEALKDFFPSGNGQGEGH